MERPKGIVFVIADALRADVFANLLRLGLIPNLAKLVDSGTWFQNAHSTTNTTDPSVTCILSGLHPLTHGIIHHGDTSAKFIARGLATPSLPQFLRRNYRTIAVDYQIPGTWHRRGYDVYVTDAERQSPMLVLRSRIRRVLEENARDHPNRVILPPVLARMLGQAHVPGAGGASSNKRFLEKTTSAALEQMKAAAGRGLGFFTFIHYWATHAPYYASQDSMRTVDQIKDKLADSEALSERPVECAIENVRDTGYRSFLRLWFDLMHHRTLWDVVASNYAALLEVDRQIGQLITWLESEGIWEKTMFVFTADHGESLGEHDIFFSHHGLYETTVRVPLVISGVALKNGADRAPVSHLDIVPTILSLLGTKPPPVPFEGCDLTQPPEKIEALEGRPLIAVETLVEKKVSVQVGHFKLIRALSQKDALCELCFKIHGGGTDELYNIADDPKETRNLWEERPVGTDELDTLAKRSAFRLRTRETLAKVPLPVKQRSSG